jgi:type IV pilus assembly protein PilC
MNLKTVAAFCRRMGVGLRAGVDILRLLDMETKLGSNQHKQTLAKVHDSIREGNTFARALLSQKHYFPPLLIQMVNAAEIGGRLDSMFTYMADYYDGLLQTRTYFLSRISWPLIQLGMAIMIIGGVILLQSILSPGGTPKFNAFVTYCIMVSLVLAGISIFIYGIWKNWFNCHRILMPIVQRIPQLGTALTTLGLARLSMTLSMLLNAGVDAKRSLKQAFLATGNYYFIGGMDRALSEVEKGNDFGDAFQASQVLPQDFIDSVRVGELSGTETESFDQLAIQYQERAKAALGMIATIASVVIWLGVILLLAFMVISMALRVMGVYKSVFDDLGIPL